MFVVLLRFGAQRALAAQHMAAHQQWIARGFDEGVFLLAGSLQPQQGGSLLAHGCTRAALQARVAEDPFVVAGVVAAEILEISPSRMHEGLKAVLA